MSLILSGTDGLSDVDGSAATPAIRGTDANTGIFFPAADTIAFAEGGAEVARFDSSGNFGLGVTPSSWATYKAIDILGYASFSSYNGNEADMSTNAYYNAGWKYKNTAAATLYQQDAGVHRWQYAGSGTAGNAITWTQAMTLDASGRLGIGTTTMSTSENLVVSNGTVDLVMSPGAFSSGNTAMIGTKTNHAIAFAINTAQKMVLDTSGNLGIGTASPSSRLSVAGNITLTTASPTISTALNDNFDIKATNAGGQVRIFSGNSLAIECNSGQAITMPNLAGAGTRAVNANASGTLSAASDSRLKQEVQGQTLPSLAEVMQLEVKAYKWLDDINVRGDGAAIEIGFFADQVAPIIPSAAPMGRDGYYGFYDRSVIAALVNAVKEQQALITTLTARITALESA
jgi:hypothetical protein